MTDAAHPPPAPLSPALERFPTGVPGLDTVLHGGLFRGGIYIVAGTPGAGKTILANQICSHHVRGGGRAVYLTLLTETHGRMLANLRTLSFFDVGRVGESLFYVSAHRELEQQGLTGLLQQLRAAVREHKSSLLVVDGVVTAEHFAESPFAFKRFIQDLQTWVGLQGCTVLLLKSAGTQGDDEAGQVQPEHTMVDGILQLRVHSLRQRRVRELLVSKLRGSGFLEGSHSYAIGTDGVRVYPRLEALLGGMSAEAPPESRDDVGSGVPGLDAVLGGGLQRGSTTLVLGSSGAGKTILGVQFLASGAREGEKGLFYGFFENPQALLYKAERLGLGLAEHVRSGRVTLRWQLPVERMLDALAHDLLEGVERTGARRLVIDGLVGFFTSSPYPERLSGLFSALTERLHREGVTTLLTEETRELFVQEIEAPVPGISGVCENILFLRKVESGARLLRLLSVMKTRDRDNDNALYGFDIAQGGLRLGKAFRPGHAVFTGVSTPSSGEMRADARKPAASKRKGVGSRSGSRPPSPRKSGR
ncbi:AAA family ATPase [Aggregicoccus sp. 17bor-14]|uniref:ATPase domain-containing protein n=1 Tax=Myxococcaceae TaxID=31 RepID=UPI00129C9528|nr:MULTISPECIES: ATPase domain-containing protein [Myxococcaceae]MBF5043905.1 AAA family ATPase [Simulacricoccus sp. 17bor-14]MRI89656.1 AAA family ATPase [Aggregicoccus sp. 17bor-14]